MCIRDRLHPFAHLGLGEPAAKEKALGLIGPDAQAAVQPGGEDALRRFFGHGLDIHAAVGRGHDGQACGGAVQDHGQVEFAGDVGALFHPDLVHLLALGAGLVGHELHAQDGPGSLFHGIGAFADLDAAALAAATGMDLRFHHPHGARKAFGHGACFLRGDG